MSDSTNFLRELLELDERQDATNVEPQGTTSPVSDPPPPQPAITPPSGFAAIVSPPPAMLEPTIVDLPPATDSESEAPSVVSIPRRATKGKWRKTYLGRPSRRRPAVPKVVSLKAPLVALKLHLNHLLEAKTLNLLLGRLHMSQLFHLEQLLLQVLSL